MDLVDVLIDNKYDQDLETDEEVLDIAIKKCSQNFMDTKRFFPLDEQARN